MKTNNNEIVNETSARIFKLDGTNSHFAMKNGFLCLDVTIEGKDDKYERVFLHRAFPYELPEEYISVQGEENHEIGMIYKIADFDDDTVALLRLELERKYYSPAITEIKSVKERYGFSYWKAKDTEGKDISFTMKDTYKNIKHIGNDEIILVDVDGNRFTIESVSSLSAKSYRKIELYL